MAARKSKPKEPKEDADKVAGYEVRRGFSAGREIFNTGELVDHETAVSILGKTNLGILVHRGSLVAVDDVAADDEPIEPNSGPPVTPPNPNAPPA